MALPQHHDKLNLMPLNSPPKLAIEAHRRPTLRRMPSHSQSSKLPTYGDDLADLRRLVVACCSSSSGDSDPSAPLPSVLQHLLAASHDPAMPVELPPSLLRLTLGSHRIAGLELALSLAGRIANPTALTDETTIRTRWTQTIHLADCCELLCRCIQSCPPVDAWACGMLFGAALMLKIAKRDLVTERSASERCNLVDIARLLQTLETPRCLALPDKRGVTDNPWNVVSAAHTILSLSAEHEPLPSTALVRLSHCQWPQSLGSMLSQRFDELYGSSEQIAQHSWELSAR